MLRQVAAFELRYQLRSPVFWVGCLIFFLMTFGSVTVDQVQIGARGNVFVNSPYAILQTLGIMGLFAMYVTVALVANVVIRDDETGFAPIIRSTRIGKRDYLVGRWFGATSAAFIVVATMPLAIWFGSLMPWLDVERIGPFHLTHYLYALIFFALPTLLISSAFVFALAAVTRSLMWSYVGAVVLLVLYFAMLTLLRDPQYDTIGSLVDPFGLSAFGVATKYWTATERNTRLPAVQGLLLYNRLIWTAAAALVFAFAYQRFRFEAIGASGRRAKAAPTPVEPPRPAAARAASVAPAVSAGTRRAQAWALARFEMAHVFRSPAFFVLLAVGVFNAVAGLWDAGRFYGGEVWPVTRLVVNTLEGAFGIIPIIIAIYYGGELVWRERERRTHEIVDATPAPDWAFLLPKIIAIALVLVATALAAVATGMVVQMIKGYTQFELMHYVAWFVLPLSITAVLLAILSVIVQVLVPQKFIGWGVMLLYLVASVALATAGFEHTLYGYADAPPVPLSDMNGMGRFWVGRAWLQAYWLAFAVMLTVIAYGLWRRGASAPLAARMRLLPQRLRGIPAVVLGVAALVWIGVGGFVYYNTNVLNPHLTAPQIEERTAQYEKALIGFEAVPQPRIAAVTLDVQVYPRETRVITRGSYVIENRTAAPLDAVHVRWARPLKMDTLAVAGAKLEKEYNDFDYRIYRFDEPMAPGEKRRIEFTTTLAERGFPNRRPLTRIVDNGTFIDSFEIAPILGMSKDQLLQERAKRRKHGLPPELRPAKLEDDAARANNGLRKDSDWVDADITVTTDADQTPVAPGYAASDETRDGRRTVRYKTDAPIMNFFSIQSARYAIARDRLNHVDLAVYYHPAHEYNVRRMLDAMKLSLAMFSEKFSPYQFKQARILEFPSYASFAQSFANTIPYSEAIGFIFNHKGDPEKIDLVTYVTAHEIGHQWWGHQVVAADQQGATMLIESFAQYSALLVMEKMYGKESIRKFLKYELDRYLRSRGGEVIEELPLARVENQQYIHYQKGSLAMYWLKEVAGEEVVNRALRRLIERYAFKPAPYPNTRDFLALLREEAGPQHEQLIADLFERITLYDMKAMDAAARRLPDGRFEVSFTVEGRKLYADGKGKETEAPLDEPFDVGVFTAEPGKEDFKPESVLHFDRRVMKSGKQTVMLVVEREPKWVGVDPYNKRIDRNSEDNLVRVEMK